MQDRRSLAWRLNWYRHCELEGALLLGRIVRQAGDGYLISRLMQHCADQARHAWLWERTLLRLELPSVQIFRSYQSFCVDYAGSPATISEVLALTHVFERRAHQAFLDELSRPGLPHVARRTFTALIRDERKHLDWVAGWLAAHGTATAVLARYRDADTRVYRQLLPFVSRMWDIPGLGEELINRGVYSPLE